MNHSENTINLKTSDENSLNQSSFITNKSFPNFLNSSNKKENENLKEVKEEEINQNEIEKSNCKSNQNEGDKYNLISNQTKIERSNFKSTQNENISCGFNSNNSFQSKKRIVKEKKPKDEILEFIEIVETCNRKKKYIRFYYKSE